MAGSNGAASGSSSGAGGVPSGTGRTIRKPITISTSSDRIATWYATWPDAGSSRRPTIEPYAIGPITALNLPASPYRPSISPTCSGAPGAAGAAGRSPPRRPARSRASRRRPGTASCRAPARAAAARRSTRRGPTGGCAWARSGRRRPHQNDAMTATTVSSSTMQRLARGEADGLGREGAHHHDGGVDRVAVEEAADDEAQQPGRLLGVADRGPQLAPGAQRVDHAELLARGAGARGRCTKIGAAKTAKSEPTSRKEAAVESPSASVVSLKRSPETMRAQVAERHAHPGQPAARLRPRDVRQQGVVVDQRGLVGEVGDREEEQADPDADEADEQGRQDAATVKTPGTACGGRSGRSSRRAPARPPR